MRTLVVVAVLGLGCGGHHSNGKTDAPGNGGLDACSGLQCQVVNCQTMGMPDTTISGTVFAPNGTLPLYGVSVYVPNSDPGAFTPGASCSRCSDGLPGNPVVTATTDEAGKFTLSGVPSGPNIPVVITIGKWRRQLVLSNVG